MSKAATLAPEEISVDPRTRLRAIVRSRPPAGTLIAGGVVAAALLWSYRPILEWLVQAWSRNPDYSHGFLVPVFSAALVWLRRDLWPTRGPARLATSVNAACGC